MVTATISSKGQITLPVAIRKQLGVKPGERVVFTKKDSVIVVEKDTYYDGLREFRKNIHAHLQKHKLMNIPFEKVREIANLERAKVYKRTKKI